MCVELPNVDFEKGKRGLLKKAKYGARDAAQNWELEFAEMMARAGFRRDSLSVCVFYREQTNVRVAVHGDG